MSQYSSHGPLSAFVGILYLLCWCTLAHGAGYNFDAITSGSNKGTSSSVSESGKTIRESFSGDFSKSKTAHERLVSRQAASAVPAQEERQIKPQAKDSRTPSENKQGVYQCSFSCAIKINVVGANDATSSNYHLLIRAASKSEAREKFSVREANKVCEQHGFKGGMNQTLLQRDIHCEPVK